MEKLWQFVNVMYQLDETISLKDIMGEGAMDSRKQIVKKITENYWDKVVKSHERYHQNDINKTEWAGFWQEYANLVKDEEAGLTYVEELVESRIQ